MNLASLVEIVLFSHILVFVMLTVLVEAMPLYSSQSPPSVTFILCVSVLLGHIEAIKHTKETLRSSGMFVCLTTNIVFLLIGIWVPTPCTRQPISFARPCIQLHFSGLYIRCLYLSTSHVA